MALKTYSIFFGFLAAMTCTNINPAQSQTPPSLLRSTDRTDSAFDEQVYLQVDRSLYIGGETVWFNAFQTQGEETNRGTTLQVELWKVDSLCLRNQYPIALGISSGQFMLSPAFTTGWYYIRAFSERTPLPSFQTAIFIVGRRSEPRISSVSKDSLQVTFHPESGRLINGTESLIVIKTTSTRGQPFAISGVIRNDKGDIITPFKTGRLGLGEFHLLPEAGSSYYAEWQEPATRKSLPLEQAKQSGTALSLIHHPEGYLFELTNKEKDSSKKSTWLIGVMRDKEVFRLPLSAKVNAWQGIIKTKTLRSGILQVIALDSALWPLAKRKVFVDNKEYLTSFQLELDSLSFRPKSKNKWRLQWPDSIRGSLSISITDATLDGNEQRYSSIVTQTLLYNEIAQSILQPVKLLENHRDSTALELDWLMLSSKDKALRPAILPSVSHTPHPKGYITLKGKALVKDTRQPVSNEQLVVILSAEKIKQNILFTQTDEAGRFSIDSLLFFGPARFIFLEYRPPKKPRPIEIYLEENSIPFWQASSNWAMLPLPHHPSPLMPENALLIQPADLPIQEPEGYTLEEVTLNTKTKSALEKLQEEYTRGPFETEAFVEKIIDLVHSDEATTYPTIFEYLRFRVPGLQIVDPDYSKSPPNPSQSGGFDPRNDPSKYRIFYRQTPSASSMGNPPMAIYFNEVEVDADILVTIPASEIALVKLFSSFTAAQGGGPGGALAIYTKKPELMKTSQANAANFTGYTPIKNYPDPNYETNIPEPEKPDKRMTLYWRSAIFLNGNTNSLPIQFFNNDRTSRYRILIEGMTVEGLPIYFEKIIE